MMNAMDKTKSIGLLVIFAASCGVQVSQGPVKPGDDYVEPSPWDLKVDPVGDKLFFEWAKDPNFFIFEKEDCPMCTWEMIADHRVTESGGSYQWWDFENAPFFGRKTYRLQKTFPYTVTWNPAGDADLNRYQVFYYGSRGLSYYYDVNKSVTSFKFNHLDPTKLPWTFTVYKMLGIPDAGRQLEIKKIVVNSETEIGNLDSDLR
jgi:hypothetical protein